MVGQSLFVHVLLHAKRRIRGICTLVEKKSEEETSHAWKIAQYMIAREAIPKIDKIDVVPQSWKGALEVFEDAY